MDFGDEDLFAVFDSESSKSKQSAVASKILNEEEDDTDNQESERPIRFDAGVLAAEIKPGKRTKSVDEEEKQESVKKVKTDDASGRTLMTGFTDKDVEKNIGLKEEEDVEMDDGGDDAGMFFV